MVKQRALALFFVWVLMGWLAGTAALAGDDKLFDTPANWGMTWILETPLSLREARIF